MQMFRIREFVRVGEPDTVLSWRDVWVERGKKLLESVGLGAFSAPASDPFFGRVGKLLANNQIDQKLKYELLFPITSVEKPTAVMSFNCHQDHFGKIFGIQIEHQARSRTRLVLDSAWSELPLLYSKHTDFPPPHGRASVREKLWLE